MNVPKLRFKEFDGEWKINKIKSIFSIRSSGDLDNKIFSSTKTDSHKFPVFGNSVVSEGLLGYYPHYEESAPALTITGRGVNIGTPFYRVVNFSAVGRLLVLHPLNNQIVPLFFSPVFSNLTIFNETTGVPQLTAPAIGNYKVSFPSLQEQMKIGVFFKLIVKKIQLQQQKIDLLQEQKKGFLQKMFPKAGETQPEIRFAGFEGEWNYNKLGEKTQVITKGTTPKDKSREGIINFIKVENLYNGKIKPVNKISEEEHQGYLKRSQLKKDDILFSIAGTLGRIAIVEENILPANTNQALAIIRGYDFDQNFLLTYLNGDTVKEYIRKNPTVGAQPNLSLEQLNNIIVTTPSIDEQIKIGKFFNKLNHNINLNQIKLENYRKQKQGFMQQMFI